MKIFWSLLILAGVAKVFEYLITSGINDGDCFLMIVFVLPVALVIGIHTVWTKEVAR